MTDPNDINPNEVTSIRQFCRMLGCTVSALTAKINAGMPVLSRGSRGLPAKIHVPTAFAWLVQYESQKQIDKAIADQSQETTEREERRRYLKAQADYRETATSRLREELVPIAEVASDVRQVYVMIRKGVMDLRGRLNRVVPVESRRLVDQECRQVLSSIADEIETYCDDIDDEPIEGEYIEGSEPAEGAGLG